MKNKFLRIILIIIFAGVFAYSAGRLLYQDYDLKKSENRFNDIINMLDDEEKSDDKEIVKLTASEKYGPVYDLNNHFAAWLQIEDSRINYPVVLTPNNTEYYLRRGFDGKYSYSGTPFMDGSCRVDTSTNTVVYAHNMKDGSMFSDLLKYSDRKYYDQHKYIHFDTVNEYRLYEIVAVFKTVVYTDHDFQYYSFLNQTDAESFNTFIQTCKNIGMYDTGVTAVPGDQLLTLSTCEYSQENGRMVVVAKLIEKSEMPI